MQSHRRLTMTTLPLIGHLREKLRSFRSAQGGNLAIIFGLALIPAVGITGAAVDYSRANSIKADIQAALDSTSLMLAKDPSLYSLSTAQLQGKAQNYFLAVFNRPEAQNVQVQQPVLNAANATLTITASADVKTAFMGLIKV